MLRRLAGTLATSGGRRYATAQFYPRTGTQYTLTASHYKDISDPRVVFVSEEVFA
jgi:hypothetical protein